MSYVFTLRLRIRHLIDRLHETALPRARGHREAQSHRSPRPIAAHPNALNEAAQSSAIPAVSQNSPSVSQSAANASPFEKAVSEGPMELCGDPNAEWRA